MLADHAAPTGAECLTHLHGNECAESVSFPHFLVKNETESAT